MYFCKKCNGHKIKTRTNKLFGSKSVTTAVSCKSCGSTEIEKREQTGRKFNRR